LSLAYEGQSAHGHTLGMGINTLPMGGGRIMLVCACSSQTMPMALHSGSEVDSVALSRPAASSFSCFFLCMWGRHETPSSWVYYIRSAHERWSTTHGQWPCSGFVSMWLVSIAYRQWAQYSTSFFLGCLFWHVGSNIQHSCTLRMGAKALITYGRRLHDAGVCLWLSNTVDRQPSPMCWCAFPVKCVWGSMES
jgi:hypothetical protein